MPTRLTYSDSCFCCSLLLALELGSNITEDFQNAQEARWVARLRGLIFSTWIAPTRWYSVGPPFSNQADYFSGNTQHLYSAGIQLESWLSRLTVLLFPQFLLVNPGIRPSNRSLPSPSKSLPAYHLFIFPSHSLWRWNSVVKLPVDEL
jgi:hypothetical protein